MFLSDHMILEGKDRGGLSMGVQKDWVETLADKLTPAVKDIIRSAKRPEEKVEVIIEYDSRRDYRRSRIRRAIRESGGIVRREFPLINAMAVEIPVSGLQTLLPEKIKRVWSDIKIKPCLNVAVPAIHGDMAHQSGYTGQGTTVAVIDTGIDQHVDLTTPKNRIVGWKDFVNQKKDPYDDNGHGTHVAGIIAGNGTQSGGKYVGVAPEAKLVGIKVLDQEGSGSISNVLSGVDWVIRSRRRYKIDVINLSLGGPAEQGYQDDPMSRMVEEAWQRGIVVCAAAGNEGPKYETINTPGIAPSIITVGNMDDRDTPRRQDDQLEDSSSRGPTVDNLIKPDILAPGTNIVSLKAGGGYISHTGTSMATPMVSGAVALIHQQKPGLTPAQIKNILLANAEDRGYKEDMQGKGYLDLLKPLDLREGEEPSQGVKKEQKMAMIKALLNFLPQLAEKGKKADPRVLMTMLVKSLGLCDEKKQQTEKEVDSKGLSSFLSFLNLTPGTLLGLISSFSSWLKIPGLPF